MLSEKSRPVIEATLPLVAERISHITPVFYQRMFAAHPELLDGVFNRANQSSGEQPQALAGSIGVFATYLIQNPDALPERMLARIAHRHTSLGITADQYQIVYDNLFSAIADDLAEVITPEIAEAWTEVYWLMADALISIERDLYASQANDKMWMPWRVAEKRPAGADAITFVLEPADETPVTPALPGQYVSVKVELEDGLHQARQYSLMGDAGLSRVFTSKLDELGEVSPVLHNRIQVGDVLEISNPYGEVVLDDSEGPVILASAGIGCAPSASMLRALVNAGSEREVLLLHADRSHDAWALSEQMRADLSRLGTANAHVWLEDASTGHELAGVHKVREGFMNLDDVELPAQATMYLCGPMPFMKAIRNQAINAGVPAGSIHYEIFGPDSWLAD